MAYNNYGVQKSSASSVLDWYNDQDETGWRIFMGRTPKPAQFHSGFTGSDKEEGLDRLSEALAKIEPTDYGYYCIQLISKSKAKDALAPMCNFQIHQPPSASYSGGGYSGMNEVLSELRALRAERMKQDQEDEDEDESSELGMVQPQQPSVQALIAGVLTHPQITNLIVNAITNLAGTIMKPTQQPVTAVAGVETDTIEQSIQILLSKGVTPEDLVKLAEMDQMQINFLLSMLRK